MARFWWPRSSWRGGASIPPSRPSTSSSIFLQGMPTAAGCGTLFALNMSSPGVCLCEYVYVCREHVPLHLRTKRGYKCATYDWQQSKRCMDFNSAAGFLLLRSMGNGDCNKPCMPAASNALSRLALYVVFNMGPDSVMLAGPDCSSWGIPARGSSKRSYINPMGLESVPFVASANCMVGRFLGMSCNACGSAVLVWGHWCKDLILGWWPFAW